jgi:DNA-binding LacI/PurR family transcriptional regulator
MALNNRPGVSDALRATVQAYAAQHGYRPDVAARTLRTNRSNILGLANRNLRNPAFLAVVEGFSEECTQAGFHVLIGTTGLDEAREEAVIEAFAAHHVDGLAISPLVPEQTLATWRSRSNGPLVFVNDTFSASTPGALSVRSDLRETVRLAMEHVLELGHRRIGTITDGPLPTPARANLLDRIAREAGVTLLSLEVGEVSTRVGQIAAALEAPDRPTALIADSDALAHHVYDAAAAVGLRIPEDLSVVGHDDLPTSHLLGPPLTTIAVDGARIGRTAARMLINTLLALPVEDGERELPVQMIVRSSTGPAPA